MFCIKIILAIGKFSEAHILMRDTVLLSWMFGNVWDTPHPLLCLALFICQDFELSQGVGKVDTEVVDTENFVMRIHGRKFTET